MLLLPPHFDDEKNDAAALDGSSDAEINAESSRKFQFALAATK